MWCQLPYKSTILDTYRDRLAVAHFDDRVPTFFTDGVLELPDVLARPHGGGRDGRVVSCKDRNNERAASSG